MTKLTKMLSENTQKPIYNNEICKMDIKEPQSLSFSEALNNVTSKITQFHGRSRRSEYWWAMVVVYLANIILTPFGGFFVYIATLPLTFRRLHDTGRSGWWWGICAILQLAFFLSLIYDWAMVVMNADNMRSYEGNLIFTFMAKYSVWFLIIAVYKIVLLVFMCIDSEQYENKYGKSPKYIDEN